MKYTKYLLKKDLIDIDPFISKKHPVYNVPLVVLSVPLLLIYIGGMIVMLPIAFTFDHTRNIHCMLIRFDRKYNLSSNVHEAVARTEAYRIVNDKANVLKDRIEVETTMFNNDMNRSMRSIIALKDVPADLVNKLPILIRYGMYKVRLSIQAILF
jgi:hypothetical protein